MRDEKKLYRSFSISDHDQIFTQTKRFMLIPDFNGRFYGEKNLKSQWVKKFFWEIVNIDLFQVIQLIFL